MECTSATTERLQLVRMENPPMRKPTVKKFAYPAL